MSHVAWSVCLCVDHTDVLCKNWPEPIEIPLGGGDAYWPREPCIRWDVKIGRIHSQLQGVASRRCDLLWNYFRHSFTITTQLVRV